MIDRSIARVLKKLYQTKTAKTPLIDFVNECGIKSAAEDTLLIHAKASQNQNIFHYDIYIGDGFRSRGI